MKNKKFLSRQMFRGVHWDDVFIFEREQTMDHNRFGGPNQIYPLPPNKKFPPKPSSFKIRSQQTSDLLKKLSEHAILEPMPIRIQTQNNIEKPVIIGNPSDRAGSGRPKKANRKKDILKNGAWHRQHAREQSRKNAINLGGTNFDQETSSIAGRTFTAVDDPKVDEGDSVNDQWLDYQDRLSKRYYDLCDLIKRLLLSESVSKLEFVMQKLNDTITSKKSASSAKVSPQHHNNKHYTGHKQHYNHQALNQPPSKPSSNYNRYQAPLPAHSQFTHRQHRSRPYQHASSSTYSDTPIPNNNRHPPPHSSRRPPASISNRPRQGNNRWDQNRVPTFLSNPPHRPQAPRFKNSPLSANLAKQAGHYAKNPQFIGASYRREATLQTVPTHDVPTSKKVKFNQEQCLQSICTQTDSREHFPSTMHISLAGSSQYSDRPVMMKPNRSQYQGSIQSPPSSISRGPESGYDMPLPRRQMTLPQSSFLPAGPLVVGDTNDSVTTSSVDANKMGELIDDFRSVEGSCKSETMSGPPNFSYDLGSFFTPKPTKSNATNCRVKLMDNGANVVTKEGGGVTKENLSEDFETFSEFEKVKKANLKKVVWPVPRERNSGSPIDAGSEDFKAFSEFEKVKKANLKKVCPGERSPGSPIDAGAPEEPTKGPTSVDKPEKAAAVFPLTEKNCNNGKNNSKVCATSTPERLRKRIREKILDLGKLHINPEEKFVHCKTPGPPSFPSNRLKKVNIKIVNVGAVSIDKQLSSARNTPIPLARKTSTNDMMLDLPSKFGDAFKLPIVMRKINGKMVAVRPPTKVPRPTTKEKSSRGVDFNPDGSAEGKQPFKCKIPRYVDISQRTS